MAGILLNRSRQAPAEDTPAFGGIAERFRRAGDLDRAIALCRDGLKKFPDQLSARVTLGWSLLDKGQYDEARAELERVLRRAPDNLAAIRGLAELHDRSEGAMPSMDDSREAWRPEETETAETSATAATPAAAAITHAPPPLAEDPFAPIAVNFSASSAASPEIVHTAEDAGRAAQEAAASAAAMALLGSDRVVVEEPASAAMAAASLDVMPFETGDDAPVALELEGNAASGSALELESAADNLLSATAGAEHQPHAYAETDRDLAETEDLVASLQQFSVDDGEPASDLVLEVSGSSEEAGLIDLAAFEPLPAVDLAAPIEGLATSEVPASLVAHEDELDVVGAEEFERIEPRASFDSAALPDATLAAYADTDDQSERVTTSIVEEAAHEAMAADEAVVASPLSDVAEVEPEPAFVPDLAFALGRADVPELGESDAAVFETAPVATDEAQLAVSSPEPEFTPDLAGVALDGDGIAALEGGRPMAIEAPPADVFAHADLGAAEPEFVPDLSSVALDGSAGDEIEAPVSVVAAEPPVGETSAIAEAVHEPAFVPDLSLAFDMTGFGRADVESVESVPAPVVAIDRPKPGLLALERFLRQVEARKLQLAQGSVA